MSRYTEATYESFKLLLSRGASPDSGFAPLEDNIKQELYELGKNIISELRLEEHEYEQYISEICYLLDI